MTLFRRNPVPILLTALFATFTAVLGTCFWTLRGVSHDVDRLADDLARLETKMSDVQRNSRDLSGRSEALLTGAGRTISPESAAALEAIRSSVNELVRRTQTLETQQSSLQKKIQSGSAEGGVLASRPGGVGFPAGFPSGAGAAGSPEALTQAIQQHDRETLKAVVEEVLEEERLVSMWTSLSNTKRQYEEMLEAKLGLTETQREHVKSIMTEHTQAMFGLLKEGEKADGAQKAALDERVRDRWRETEDRVRALLAPEQEEVFNRVRWYH